MPAVPPPTHIRVVIADEHTLVRAGLRLLLETMPGVTVVGEAADGHQVIRLIDELRPDVVITDVTIPGMTGLEIVRASAAEFPDTRVLVLSICRAELYVQQSLAAGAAGYLLKGADESELEHALSIVARGHTYISPSISQAVVAVLARAAAAGVGTPSVDALTSRQREILTLIAEGLTTKKIAARLRLSAKTVEAHRAAIMDRLGIRDLAGLVRFAIRAGLVASDS